MEQESYLRIVKMHQLIKNKVYPNCSSLQDKLKVSERTILRDIDLLKETFNAPIKYSKKNNGYYYAEESFELANISLTSGDLIGILIGKRLLEDYRNTPFYEELCKAYERIAKYLPEFINFEKQDLLSVSIDIHKSLYLNLNNIKILKNIVEAMSSKHKVGLEYREAGAKGNLVSAHFMPINLSFISGDWYLDCREDKVSKNRLINIRRITKCKVLLEGFTLENGQSNMPETSLFKAKKEENSLVKIKFSSKIADLIADRFSDDLQATVSKNNKGDLIVQFTTDRLEAVYQWVLSFGPVAELLEPISLRSRIRKELVSMISLY